eukprot:750227-Hanusia_phi.AAC.2
MDDVLELTSEGTSSSPAPPLHSPCPLLTTPQHRPPLPPADSEDLDEGGVGQQSNIDKKHHSNIAPNTNSGNGHELGCSYDDLDFLHFCKVSPLNEKLVDPPSSKTPPFHRDPLHVASLNKDATFEPFCPICVTIKTRLHAQRVSKYNDLHYMNSSGNAKLPTDHRIRK